jgi:hypothetical protein
MKKIVGILCSMLCTIAIATAQSDLQPLATVKLNKTESITLKQLKARVEVYQKQAGGATFTVDQKKEILDSMIDEKLVVQAAAKAGISITDSAANEYFLNSISSQVGQAVTEQEFATIVKEQMNMSLDDFFKAQVGMSLAEYKSYLKNQLIAQQYVVSQKRSMLENVSPTDAEVRAFYEMNKSSFVQNDILKIFLVVVPKNSDSAAAKTKATSLYNDLKGNKVTANELKIKMAAPDSGFQAGEMYVSKGTTAAQQLGIDYNALLALFERDIGFASDLNETATDYQFYTIREKYSAKMLALSDVVQPDTTITVYEYIKNQLAQQKQTAVFAQAVEAVTAELRTPENFQMVKTGDALNKLLNW